MNSASAAWLLLADLPTWAFAAALVFARVGCVCMMLPGIGEAEVPMTVRAGFVLALTALMLPVLTPDLPAAPGDVIRLFMMIIAEIITGLWLGWLVRLVLLAPALAGQLIAGAIGMTNIIQPDPHLGPSTAALSRLFGLAAPVIILGNGLYAYPLGAMLGSYHVIPAGHVLPVADTVDSLVSAVGETIGLGFRMAAPFLLASVLFHATMGLIGRLVPHIQLHFAAAPGQILGGLLLLSILASSMFLAWIDSVQNVLTSLPGL